MRSGDDEAQPDVGSITVGRLKIPYAIRKSETATRLRLQMTVNGLVVTVPSGVDEARLQDALKGKRRWIVENHHRLQQKIAQTPAIARFHTGAKVPYWGRMTALTLAKGIVTSVCYRNGIQIELPQDGTPAEVDHAAENALRDWLLLRAKDEAGLFARRYAEKLGVSVPPIRVLDLKTRWGSCGSSGLISLDWHLVFGPKRVLAYTVAHEVVHLIIRNHGDGFWNKLKGIFGDYGREYDWLMRNEHLLGYRRIPTDTLPTGIEGLSINHKL